MINNQRERAVNLALWLFYTEAAPNAIQAYSCEVRIGLALCCYLCTFLGQKY